MIETKIEARQEMLSSIREHLAASARFDAQAAHPQTAQRRTQSNSATDARNGTVLDLFRQALEAVSGHCSIVQSIDEAARAVQQVVDERKARRVAVSDSIVVKRILGQLKTEAVFLDAPNQSELFECDMGITATQWAIAETGTLVLESERERHRLASLVPPVHVAIIEAGRIRRTMSEILQLIKNSEVGLSRTVTFITGPSRTSDIELTLAIGVHGPGELHVIVIDEPAQPA
ncbi:MAG TPA: lactate utilization protein [Pyrinomonadaceae bacterium]|nr:lactate utilization protein [Pyrinomonadaceae bacterium]